MKKNKNFRKLLIFAIAALMCFTGISLVASAAYVQVGTGTYTTYYAPFYGYYNYGWSEELLLQSEIGSAININALSYNNINSITYPLINTNQKVYMMETTLTSLSSTAKPDTSTGWTLVYSGTFTLTATGWNTLNLNTAFSYGGVKNLLIYWENDRGSYNYPYPYWQGTYIYPYREVYAYSDSSLPTSGYTSSYMSNIRLGYQVAHDAAMVSIQSPKVSDFAGTVPVQILVKNNGLSTDNIPVNVRINYIGKPKTVFYQDFTGLASGAIPTGWTRTGPTTTNWGASLTTNAGGVSPEMMFYYSPLGTGTYRLYTNAIDTTGQTSLTLTFLQMVNHYTTPYTLSVETSTDASTWSTVWSINPTATINAQTVTIPLTTTNGIGSSHLYISWTFTGYTNNINYWYIDNILLKFMGLPPTLVYTGTATSSSLAPGATTIVALPSWVVTTSGSYVVNATTALATDMDNTNNKTSQITTIGLADASTTSIDIPHALMGPNPFQPKATVSNNGDWDFSTATIGQLPVRATIPDPRGGTGLTYTEDFEGPATSFYQYTGQTETILDPEAPPIYKYGNLSGTEAVLRWPNGESQFGSPSAWTIIDQNGDGTTWHQTSYRSISPTHSMYNGNDATHQYPSNSRDWLISPKVYVGPNGGMFTFDFCMYVQAPSDYMYFGCSKDGVSWSMYWFGGWTGVQNAWYTTSVGVPPSQVDANGFTHFGVYFYSNSAINYEGINIDDVNAYGSPLLYDQTVYVDLVHGTNQQVTFPTFTPLANYSTYDITVCCAHKKDAIASNDCLSQIFNTGAPVYNTRTDYGYATIQAAINDPATIAGDTINASGNFYENLIINKGVTVQGASAPDCYSGSTYLFGTVDIVADGVTFENFYVKPLDLFTADQGAISIYSNNVIVTHNTVEISGATTGTIKGIYAYATPSGYKQNIEISDNCVHDVYNTLGCHAGGGGGTIFYEGFEGGAIPSGWTQTSYPGNTGYWEISTYGGVVYYEPPTTPTSGTYFATANSDGHSALVYDVGLFTPAMDLTGYTNIQLKVTQAYHPIVSGEYGEINIYSGGVLQSQLWYSTTSYDGTLTIPIDTTGYPDLTNVKIEFRYSTAGDTYMWSYSIDDVNVSGTSSGGGGGGYGGADGIMVQGAVWNVKVLRNTINDIISPGWSNGIEVTPTALDPQLAHFYANLGFYENFTTCAAGTIPPGWTRDLNNWGASLSNNAGGVSPEMEFNYYPTATGDFYLTSPVIDTSSFSTLSFSFRDYVNHFTTPYTLKVVAIAGANEYTIDTWSPTASTPATLHTYTLTAAQGVGASNFQLAWVFSGYTWNINYWYIDNIALTGSYDYWATVNPWPLNVNISGNTIKRISIGPSYTCDNPPVYPGIMLNINYANLPSYGPTPADASQVTCHHNFFDAACYYPVIAILNTDLQHCLDATDNYYGVPDGPGSYDPLGGTAVALDCYTGEPADGVSGSQIAVYGPVHFDPWLGLNAKTNIVSPYNAIAGTPVLFDGSASWANDFQGKTDPYQYYWNFGDGSYSMEKTIAHVYTTPGTYNGYLRVEMLGIPELGIPPLYEWSYFTIVISGPSASLTANAGGGSLSNYVTSIGQSLTLYGTASGGTAPYTYQWTLGNGRTADGQNPTVQYKLAGTYTVTLTVIDANNNVAQGTATVTVTAPEELNVIISAPANAMTSIPVSFTSTVAGGKTPYTYSWNFGDQTTSTQANPLHIFENGGQYTVTLTVTDNTGATKTATKTIEIQTAAGNSAEIKSVTGGIKIKATIVAGDNNCDWSINVNGNHVLSGGKASGTIQSNTQQTVKLPITIAFGKVQITVTADNIQEQYTAIALGPIFLNLHKA